MPILWRYLLSQYLKVLVLSVVSIIAVLLTTRLDEIARFAALGAPLKFIMVFAINQIPYVFPIALPISCLISTVILIQRLSTTHELTAMRACGIGIHTLLTPVLLAAAFLSIANFYVVSEMATQSHLETGLLKTELRSINPLLLLHNKHLMRLKGIYFETLGASRIGEHASEVILAMANKSNNQINLLLAKRLDSSPTSFVGNDVTLISSLETSKSSDEFDDFVIENMGESTTTIDDFSNLIEKKVWVLNNDHLRLPLLYVRLKDNQKNLELAKFNHQTVGTQKVVSRNIIRIYSEIMRRISMAASVFTFTLMGAAFGISISRRHSSRGIVIVICLAAFYLIAFFAAKGSDHLLAMSAILYFMPHLLICTLSLCYLKRVTKGIE